MVASTGPLPPPSPSANVKYQVNQENPEPHTTPLLLLRVGRGVIKAPETPGEAPNTTLLMSVSHPAIPWVPF